MSLRMRALYQLASVYWRLVQPVTLGVQAMLIRNEQILLVRHSYRPGWCLPGGGVDRNETLETAVRRELHEEIRATPHTLAFFGIYTNTNGHKSDHITLFLSEDFEWQPNYRTAEIAEARLFPLQALPPAADLDKGVQRRVHTYVNGRSWPEHNTW